MPTSTPLIPGTSSIRLRRALLACVISCLALGALALPLPAAPKGQGKAPAKATSSNPLVGQWFSQGATGSIVDVYNGDFRGVAYGASWYQFEPDGRFLYVIVGGGTLVTGVSRISGRYKVRGNVATFSGCKESWRPRPGDNSHEPAYDKPRPDCNGDYPFQIDDKGLSIFSPTAPKYRISPDHYGRSHK